MSKKRRHDHGAIYHGRFEPDESHRLMIHTYIHARLSQARASLDTARAAHARMRTEQSAGLVQYWEHVVGYLSRLARHRSHSVDAVVWAESARHVETERVTGSAPRPDQPSLPGMGE